MSNRNLISRKMLKLVHKKNRQIIICRFRLATKVRIACMNKFFKTSQSRPPHTMLFFRICYTFNRFGRTYIILFSSVWRRCLSFLKIIFLNMPLNGFLTFLTLCTLWEKWTFLTLNRIRKVLTITFLRSCAILQNLPFGA